MLTVFVHQSEASIRISMKVGSKNFSAEFEDNTTSREILKNMPLNLSMKRYAEHEYFTELSFTPKTAKERTSQLKAGGIYYWGGGNSFVINFNDYDIAPYNSVYLGAVDEVEELCEFLRGADEVVSVTLKGEN